MKFLIAKNEDKICLECRASILYGEHYFQKFSYRIKRAFFFHIECYRKWSDKNFVKAYLEWKDNLDPPKVRGRPVKSTNPKEYRRLKALCRHHRRAGNTDRVGELEGELKGLEVSNGSN